MLSVSKTVLVAIAVFTSLLSFLAYHREFVLNEHRIKNTLSIYYKPKVSENTIDKNGELLDDTSEPTYGQTATDIDGLVEVRDNENTPGSARTSTVSNPMYNKQTTVVKSTENTIGSVEIKIGAGHDSTNPKYIVAHNQTQKSRKNNIYRLCKSQHNMILTDNVRGHYYPHGPFYYCNVPKLATTFLLKLFSTALYGQGIDKPFKLTKHDFKDIFSYINVGDPYSRIFSAYKGKLYKPDVGFWQKLGIDVVKTVRRNYKKAGGFDVTFEEMIQYVINFHDNRKTLNSHLEPIHKLCNPCATNFDFISKKETLTDDLVDLFDIMKNAGIVKDDIPINEIGQDLAKLGKRGYGSVRKLFDAVRTYPNIPTHKLFLRHWSMFHIGGYMLNKYEMPFNESIIKTVSAKQYEEALIAAVDNSEGYKGELRLQRHEALVQAYRSVPLKLMYRLRDFVLTDCKLFSYDDKPAFLFDRETFNEPINHVYMKGL